MAGLAAVAALQFLSGHDSPVYDLICVASSTAGRLVPGPASSWFLPPTCCKASKGFHGIGLKKKVFRRTDKIVLCFLLYI